MLLICRRQQPCRPGTRKWPTGIAYTNKLAILLCILSLTMVPVSRAGEEGGDCEIMGMTGKCTGYAKCEPIVDSYIQAGKFKGSDVPSCGFGLREEIICCPVVECCENANGQNEATIVSVQSSSTTTTSTTPSQLKIGNAELDAQSSFFDFQRLLSAGNKQTGSESVPSNNSNNYHSLNTANNNRKNQANSNNALPLTHQSLQQEARTRGQGAAHREHNQMHRSRFQLQNVGPWIEESMHGNMGRRPTIVNRPLSQRPPMMPMTPDPMTGVAQPTRLSGAGSNLHLQDVGPWGAAPAHILAQTTQQQTATPWSAPKASDYDPVRLVNERLRQQGMAIVEAKPVSQFEFSMDRRPTTTSTTSTTARPIIYEFDNPFAPFQFNAKPVSDVISNALDNVDLLGSRTTTTTPTVPTVITRVNERPAVQACRAIERKEGIKFGITPHILDGIPVAKGVYPHMAAIAFGTFGNTQFRCGGSLIAKRFVLTAAHCVNDFNDPPKFVRLGTINIDDLDSSYQDINVVKEKIQIPEEYASTSKYYDIAILELAEDARYSTDIYPACLETDLTVPPANTKVFVAGWGTTDQPTRNQSKVLLRAPLQMVDLKECNESYVAQPFSQSRLASGIQLTQMCAADRVRGKADACQGDSGGPLILEKDSVDGIYSIVGIISAGFGCNTNTPGLYTRVASYMDFIEKHVWPSKRRK